MSLRSDAKTLGMPVRELYGINVRYTADERVAYYTPRPSPVPLNLRALAGAMLELVIADLHLPTPRWAVSGTVYDRDPESATMWLRRVDDAPFSPRWCCDLLNLDLGAVRDRLLNSRKRP